MLIMSMKLVSDVYTSAGKERNKNKVFWDVFLLMRPIPFRRLTSKNYY